jgi:hypothetical protein
MLLGTAYNNPLPDTASLTFMHFLYKKLSLKKMLTGHFLLTLLKKLLKICIMKTSSLQCGLHHTARQLKVEGYKKE